MQRHHAPYRADVVGSFLRPDAIKQARLKFASGEIDAGQLRAVEDEAIRHVVEQQCACGLHVVTDGEFRRAWWHFDFFDGLQGVERYDSQQGIQFNGVQTKAHGVRVTGKLHDPKTSVSAGTAILYAVTSLTHGIFELLGGVMEGTWNLFR